MNPKKIILSVDGGARGNPGPAGAGAYLTDASGEVLAEVHRYLGETTNNVAEYSSLIIGLEEAARLGAKEVSVRMDSQLVVRQLEGTYQVKQAHLRELFEKVQKLLKTFKTVEIKHIPREENSEADRLANLAMDEGSP